MNKELIGSVMFAGMEEKGYNKTKSIHCNNQSAMKPEKGEPIGQSKGFQQEEVSMREPLAELASRSTMAVEKIRKAMTIQDILGELRSFANYITLGNAGAEAKPMARVKVTTRSAANEVLSTLPRFKSNPIRDGAGANVIQRWSEQDLAALRQVLGAVNWRLPVLKRSSHAAMDSSTNSAITSYLAQINSWIAIN